MTRITSVKASPKYFRSYVSVDVTSYLSYSTAAKEDLQPTAPSLLSPHLPILSATMPPPDADLHPVATGPAKIIVDKHSSPGKSGQASSGATVEIKRQKTLETVRRLVLPVR